MSDLNSSFDTVFEGYTLPDDLIELFRSESYAERVRKKVNRNKSLKVRPTINLETHMPKYWDVRDQRPRGTCTAFAVAACVDIMQAASSLRYNRHSPEFLYWYTREAITEQMAADLPDYDKGATKLLHAHQALAAHGICLETLALYQTSNLDNDLFSQQKPTEEAQKDARHRKYRRAAYDDFWGGPVAENTADKVLDELKSGRPVAIGLPVFSLHGAYKTNWTYDGALNSGIVPDPASQPGLVDEAQRGSGHCICITGFQPGPEKFGGGWFIFRNSWNGDFGKYPGRPVGGYPGIGRRGNGAISYHYVEGYTVEYLSIRPAT